jgi:hypothetical protein
MDQVFDYESQAGEQKDFIRFAKGQGKPSAQTSFQ